MLRASIWSTRCSVCPGPVEVSRLPLVQVAVVEITRKQCFFEKHKDTIENLKMYDIPFLGKRTSVPVR